MTDPTDDTQSHRTVDPDSAASGAPAADKAPATDHATPAADHATPAADGAPGADPATPPEAGSGPSLRADPDRPADSGWREPPWFPPRDRGSDRDRRPSVAAMVIGLILIAIGAYYFLDRTLGISLPRIQWSSIWPIILIVIGGLILVRSFQRKS